MQQDASLEVKNKKEKGKKGSGDVVAFSHFIIGLPIDNFLLLLKHLQRDFSFIHSLNDERSATQRCFIAALAPASK